MVSPNSGRSDAGDAESGPEGELGPYPANGDPYPGNGGSAPGDACSGKRDAGSGSDDAGPPSTGRVEAGNPAGSTAGSGEFETIAALQARFEAAAGRSAPVGELWIGDDAAVVSGSSAAPLLLATDLVVAGVHVDLDRCTLADLGFKAVMVTVSDVAAMGGRPNYLLVSVAAPPGTDLELLGTGVAEAAAATGGVVVGGDLSTAPVIVVSVAVLGDVSGREGAANPGGSPVPGALTRAGARAGDSLFVTGPLGASSAGLRILRSGGSGDEVDAMFAALARAYRRPVARLAEGESARLAGASAAIDISDGLASDIRHLAGASGVGIAIDHVPVALGATQDEALGGGEDYELILATGEPDGLVRAFDSAGLRVPIAIGICTPDPGERTFAGRDLPDMGWRHQFG